MGKYGLEQFGGRGMHLYLYFASCPLNAAFNRGGQFCQEGRVGGQAEKSTLPRKLLRHPVWLILNSHIWNDRVAYIPGFGSGLIFMKY